MIITIHRGTHQIGGCITEIKSQNARIIIDMGSELADGNSPLLAEIEGVTIGKPNCDGVFITHYHGDHIGLFDKILPEIPIYLGVAAKDIFLTLSKRMKITDSSKIVGFKTYKAVEKITLKDITITPIAVDHSAFDSYMFLIESGGQKILHSGDFRTHGFRGKGVIPSIKKYVGIVDVLITEGTMLSRNNENIISERELQIRAKKLMSDSKFVFVLCSSTNIDRIAAFYHANPKGRYFICDEYQKDILDIVTQNAGHLTDLYNFQKVLVYGSNLDEKLKIRGFCMLIRSSDYFEKIIERFETRLLIYSMWKGYIAGNSRNSKIANFINSFEYEYLHTSGHATNQTIKTICNIVKPKIAIIPIHSEVPKNISKLNLLFPIKYLHDKEEFEVK